MKLVHGRPGRGFGSGALWILSALAGILSLGALVLPGSREVERLERDRHRLELRLEQVGEREAAGAASGELNRRSDSAAALLACLFPIDVGAIDDYGMVRGVAEANDLRLNDVSLSEVTATLHASSSLPLGMREISLRGTGELEGLTGLLEDLRALGVPAVVIGFEFSFGSDPARELGFNLTLGFLQRMSEFSAPEHAEAGP